MSKRQRMAIDMAIRALPKVDWSDVPAARRDFEQMMAGRPLPADVAIEPFRVAGLRALRFTPAQLRGEATLLYLHGGGYVVGSPETSQALTATLSGRSGLRAVSVDYRLAPEHPFPAATQDALAAYAGLAVDGPVVLAGDSAGGNLAIVTALAAVAAGLRAPTAVVAFSPGTDMAMAGEHTDLLAARDPLFRPADIASFRGAYLAGHDPRDPQASPLYADASTLAGLAPTIVQAGGNELQLQDATRFAVRAALAGADVVLDVTGGVPHVFQGQWGVLAEADLALDRAAAFVAQQLARVP